MDTCACRRNRAWESNWMRKRSKKRSATTGGMPRRIRRKMGPSLIVKRRQDCPRYILPVGLLGSAALLFKAFEHVPETLGRLVNPLKRICDAFEFRVALEGFNAADEVGARFFYRAADAPHVIFEALGDIK